MKDMSLAEHDAEVIQGPALYQYWNWKRAQNEHPTGMYRR